MGCSKSKQIVTVPSRYIWMEYSGENEEKKQNKFEIKTEVKKNREVFHAKLGGLNATAVMLSYFGTRREVCQMLQKLSHSSRTYIVEQEGLPGFLVLHYPMTQKL